MGLGLPSTKGVAYVPGSPPRSLASLVRLICFAFRPFTSRNLSPTRILPIFAESADAILISDTELEDLETMV